MKLYNNHHSLIVLLLLLVLSSCHATYKVSTQAISLKGTDSITIKEESLPIKGLRILLVNRIENNEKSFSTPSTDTMQIGKLTRNDGIYIEKVTGEERNRFYSQVASAKAMNSLRQQALLFEADNSKISSERALDSVCTAKQIDLVIINEGIAFSINQESTKQSFMSNRYSNEIITSDQALGVTSGLPFMSGTYTYSSTVYYLAHWSLYWKDNSEESGFRKQTILQKGGFWNPKDKEPQADILSCALKAGEDFARLFK